MTTPAHRSLVVLNWPSGALKIIAFVQIIVQLCTNNKWLASAAALVTAVSNALTVLISAQTDVRQRKPGAKEVRDAAALKLKAAVELLANAVQAAADANTADSLAIIGGAGFRARTVNFPKKPKTKARLGAALGTVLLDVLAVLGAITYYWQMSADKGTTWTDLLPTKGSKTTVTGLASGTTYYFRFRVLLKGGFTDWSQSFYIHVS